MGRLPEAWIAPPEVRGLREEVRHRCKLVALRSGLKAQVHSVLAKQGVHVPMSDLFGVGGTQAARRAGAWTRRSTPGCCRCAGSSTRSRSRSTFWPSAPAAQLARHPGYRAIQAIPGVGPVLAAVFVAEIGDVTRFARPRAAVLLGRHDPQAPRVRHQGPPRSDHQAGQPPGPLGRGRGRATPLRRRDRAHPGPARPNDAARTSPRSPPPASCSPWSTTGCATGTSVAWPDQREHRSGAARTRGRGWSDPHPVARSTISD